MVSQYAELYADAAVPAIDEQLGEAITWLPLDDATMARTIRAVWCETEAEDDTHRGRENKRTGYLTVLDNTLPIDQRDAFVIAGVRWKTRSVQKGSDPTIVCKLERHERDKTNRGGKLQ